MTFPLEPVPGAVVALWRCPLCRRPVKARAGAALGAVLHQCDHARYLVVSLGLGGLPVVTVQTRG